MVAAVIALGVGVLLVANGGLGKVTTVLGSTFSGLLTDLTKTPVPSASEPIAASAPTLEPPGEPYTSEATIDLVGTVPAAVVGQADVRIRIYVAIGKGDPGVAVEVPVGPTQRFTVPGVTLSPGANTFTASILGPGDLESDRSAAVTYILDTTKPKVTVSSPKANALINARVVQVIGKTQARSAISIRNQTTGMTVAGAADDKGAFSIAVAIGTGTNTILITATDPAGNVNTATLAVRRGNGTLTARVSASFYQVKLAKLPETVQLTVVVTDPDGGALKGASVTFTLAVPGVPAISSSVLTTDSNGRATFTTSIPKGATVGQCSITAIVSTTNFGDTTDRTVITIQK